MTTELMRSMFYNLPEGDFTLRDIRNLMEIANFINEEALYCFMDGESLNKIRKLFKIIPFMGAKSTPLPVNNNEGFENADKITYGNTDFHFVQVDDWSTFPNQQHINNMVIVTKDGVEEFIQKLKNKSCNTN